ncbi:MAG TPA: peroxiredoxin family protein [Verrucomicrobiae bacterium]
MPSLSFNCASVRGALLCPFLGLVFSAGLIQAADETGPLAGHSMHGDAFNEGPRQKAFLMGETGRIHFPITTKSAQAQKFFNQGVGQLHGFWYFEAERSFRQAAMLDPDCATVYWGMAMANVNNAKRARGFIEKAVYLKSLVSAREGLWIDALAEYRKEDKRDDKQRRKDYQAALEKIVAAYPDDIEAKAFCALQYWDNNSKGVPMGDKQKVDAMLKTVLAAEPLHPVHHYRIHLWDDKGATNALNSAALNGYAEPDTAHMWHMSGHTYTKLNRYSDAAWQQEASARTDHAYMMKNRVMPDQIHNFAHNNEWLIRNLNFIGSVDRAVDLAKNMIELPRHPKYNTLAKGSANYGYQRLAETLVRYEMWPELVALGQTTYLEPLDNNDQEVRRLRALGTAHFNLSDVSAGKAQLAALEKLKIKIEADAKKNPKSEPKKDEESKSKEESKPQAEADKKEEKNKTAGNTSTNSTNRLTGVNNAIAELQGWEALKAGDAKKAREAFAKSKDIPKERQSQIEWFLGDNKKAEQLALDAVKGATNQVQPLAHYVDISYRNGNYETAYKYFFQLRDLAAEADLNAPVFQRLKTVASDLDFPADWRPALKREKDFGKRPSLASLGPIRWQPSAAPAWSLPNAENRQISLKQYKGKPVIVIFYLGHGCPHCIQQLAAFAPETDKFTKLGISLIAVSTDSVDGLKKTEEKVAESGGFPFPLVSDKSMNIFKAYRAFDDFENLPLHGTYLIDGDGLVRWQDISYDPFVDTKFLLGEAQRLLGKVRVPELAATPAKVKEGGE